MVKKIKNEVVTNQEFSVKTIFLPLLAVIVGMFMVIMDSTVVNVALPKMAQDFNSDLPTMQWTVTGYTLALSAVIPLAGWLTDHFGAKRIFLITIGLFTIGSVLCSLAVSPAELIIFRVIQGLGGGMVAPIGMTMVFRLAPADKVGSVMAVLGVPMMLAPALGPVLSGWLVEYSSWEWIFLINLPIGIAALLIGFKFLHKFDRREVPELDVKGMILAPIAFATLAFAVNRGGTDGWGATSTMISLIGGGVVLLLFIIVELQRKQPLLELRVFQSSDFTRGIVLTWVMQIALFGSFLLIPFYLQTIKGYGPFDTGLILLPQAFAAGVFMPLGGKMYDRYGARPMALIGLSIITAGLYMFSRVTVDTGLIYVMGTLAMMGGGMGLSMMAINTHVLQSAPKKLVSRVTSLTTAAQQVMVSFAVAGLTGFLASRVTHYMPGAQGNIAQSTQSAFEDTFLLAAGIAFIGVLLGIILRRPKRRPGGEGEEAAKTAKPNVMPE